MFKRSLPITILLLMVVVVVLGGMYWWIWSGLPLSGSGGAEKQFVVQRGDGINIIGDRLKQQGLIKSPFRFKIYLYFNKDIGKNIQAGSYVLNPEMSVGQIAATLTKGTNDQWVTIIEGLRQEQIAQQLIDAGFNFDLSEWNDKVRQEGLEGKLFPDTYLIPRSATVDKSLSILTSNYQKKVVVGLNNAIVGSDEYSEKDYLILASLVEREARSDTSRPIVAGIIIKRLSAGWPLQVDATVQYALASSQCLSLTPDTQSLSPNCDWWKKSLSRADLQINSPYNTYLAPGLPPGPICNPSLSAIKAVLSPTQSDYWFYLTGNDNQMHYAKTAEEHALNVQKYLR